MDLTRLRQINEQKAASAVDDKRHSQLLVDNTRTQEVIVQSIATLVDYLDTRVGKTEVVNQLTEIGTPDALKVVSALDSLHDTLKQHKNTDLTEITKVMRGVFEEVQKIPKSNPELPEQQFVDYSAQLKQLQTAVQAIEKAVKAQKLSVEAPVVNVPETVVNVEKPDFKPVEKSITDGSKDVVKAVKGIKIPEFKTDPVEKLLKKTNKLLEDLPNYMPSGGGGGGSSWVAVNEEGIPVPIQLDANGNLPTVQGPSTSSVTSVDDTASNTELLAANTARKEAVITNDSTSVLYVSFGETATTTNYTARLEQYGYVKTDYKGQINGIWASNSTGAARITELT